ncbi:unnamed protein product [Cylicocyclus nassatus]|uniref:Uncharacterized protein n=1 Tax=Cylicocyclus nassatus TaxID=53992 RepID=A0AA36H3S3_CYLNA|nr:unnamed protein product [Cylicocyclus nassatus]
MSSPYAPTKARVLPRRVHAKPRTLLDLTSPRVVQAPVVEDVVAASQDVFFGVEQEVPQGNVYERREFYVEETRTQRQQYPPLPATLHDCIERGVLNLDKAAKVILKNVREGKFNEATYYEFVRSEMAAKATPTYGSLNQLVGPDINFLWSIANRLTAEVGRAITSKCVRIVNVTERTTAPTIQTSVSILNCTRSWNLDVEPPFVKKNLGILGARWEPRVKDPPYQQLCSFYRHLLTRITDPPEKIKEYSIRLHSRNGRDDKLKSLPEPVENILQDMAEDMLGYGQDELKVWLDQDLSNSTFYKSLGANEEERRANLEDLRNERAEWRPQIFKALQLALRDVRGYKYEAGKWIPNQRRGKREVNGMIEAVPECSRYGTQLLEEPDENLPPNASPPLPPPNPPLNPPRNPPPKRRRR